MLAKKEIISNNFNSNQIQNNIDNSDINNPVKYNVINDILPNTNNNI